MHKSQIFFYLLCAFILGVFISSFVDFSQSDALILLMVGISVLALFGFKNKKGLLISFLIIFFTIGILRFNHVDEFSGGLKDFIGDNVELNGYVDNEPDTKEGITRFIFKSGGERILVTTSTFPIYKYGDKLLISGKLAVPENFTHSTISINSKKVESGQADFDYATYLKKDGVRMTMFYPEIKDGEATLGMGENIKYNIYNYIFDIKKRFEGAINLSIPEPNASFINGILLGTRQNIPDDLKEVFKKTGTTHILAISGYNIMIISEAVLLGLVWFFRRRVAFWISVAVIILFVILTGASASVVRAAVMGLILSFAHGYGRFYDQKNSIILAGAVMIWLNPLVLVFDIGFQLSFVAVLGLIYLYPWLDYKLSTIPDTGGLKDLALMTLSAQIVVAPLLIYYFGNFSLISLPVNILILSFLPYAMLAGFLSGLAGMFFIPLGQLFGYIAWAITTYQVWVVNFFA